MYRVLNLVLPLALCFALCCLLHISHSEVDEDSQVVPVLDVEEGKGETAQEQDPSPQEVADKSKDGDGNKKTELTFDRLYLRGVQAYEQQLWYSCASKIEKALADYKNYKRVLSDCRLNCSKGVRSSNFSSLTSNIADFSTFSKFLKAADCFRRCKDEALNTHPRVTERLEEAFEKRTPYQYLQFCYFKLDRVQAAASAAYTYYLRNTEDPDTKQNIVYYRDKAGVSESEFVDLELIPYKEHYIRSMMAYQQEEWLPAITDMELALQEFFKEEERCRTDCEAHGKMRGTEFSTVVADLLISILSCQLSCPEKLSVIYSEPTENFLPDMYHHLQFAYYKAHDLIACAELTESILLLNPAHQIMKENKEVLKSQLGYSDKDFVARKEVVDYVAMRKEMENLMDFINKNYKWPDANENIQEEEMEMTEILDRMREEATPDSDDWMTRYEQLGMHLIAKSVDLNRAERFVTDGLLKAEQCEELLTLTEDLRLQPTGAQKFDLSVAKTALTNNPSEEYETSLRLFIRAAEVVRHYTQRYVQPEGGYYLKYTSIVCWTQHDPEATKKCYPQEDGTCLEFDEMSDELFSDAFTTVTYLNRADEDADFQFLNDKEEVDSSFGVKCGRTVGFNSGDRHALKPPKKRTQRCAMVLRFTVYRSDDERDYQEILQLLHRIDELRLATAKTSSVEVLQKLKKEGVEIIKEGDELKGKDRFLADGLASDAQCDTLKNMVLELGKTGDGYNGVKTPHTVNEMFAGLSLSKVMQLMHQGMISTFGMRAFLELSEKSRLMVEKYFKLTRPLYFDYTHLVCRTAIDDSKTERQDLSHPVHADNCVLHANGSCTKEYPAFTQRDWSALLYLNEDFEGGEFFFANSDKSEQISLRPKCGRLVGFNAGDFHGVRAVKSGQRCALALWFTHNPNFKELAHIQAKKVLKQVEIDQKPAHSEL